jgi:citrate lyase beta subunit
MTSAYRSLLFVPGDRPDRFDKAVASGADAIIIDLEDAVLPDAKERARSAALGWLKEKAGGVQAGLRVNSPRTAHGCADIAALAPMAGAAAFVMVPKAETAVDMEIVVEALGGEAALIAVVESPRGLSNALDIAARCSGGLLFGGADYSASLGADLSDWDAMLHARSVLCAAASGAGVSAYDVPYLAVDDQDGLRSWTMRAKALGFSGRSCIHPTQVATVNEVFTPSAAEIAHAREVIDALHRANGGAVLHKGRLIDRPIITAAGKILAKAGH